MNLRLQMAAARALVACGWLAACTAAVAADVLVSAAASLGPALREMVPLFQGQHPGTPVRLNLAASGALLAQAGRGAPVDVLVTADTQTMDMAQSRGLVRAEQRRELCSNTLVLVVPAAARRVPGSLADLTSADFARMALGVPASVPAGRHARSALEAVGLWRALEPKVIGTHHVRQALEYVARGEVDAGFVYATDAASAATAVRVAFSVPTPERIVYAVAPLVSAPNPAGAARFVDFLLSPVAQAVLARHGFGRP